jgi:hypothetical protein
LNTGRKAVSESFGIRAIQFMEFGEIMVYINIPFSPENNRIEKDLTKKEIQLLGINDSAKQSAFAAIYNLKPRGVNFESSAEANLLEGVLRKLGIPFRQTEESEY